jgi:hypothetical protein
MVSPYAAFFAEADFNFEKVAKYLLSLFTDPNEKVFLTMDRTNWQYGTKDINILMVGVVYKEIAIPIVWEILDRRGNSNTAERIKIINRIISYFGQERIAGILADREFIGKEWFKYLENLKNPFVIRIKANTLVPNAHGEATPPYLYTSETERTSPEPPTKQVPLYANSCYKQVPTSTQITYFRLPTPNYSEVILCLLERLSQILPHGERIHSENLFFSEERGRLENPL